jgi:predicted nucleotidyltransferase
MTASKSLSPTRASALDEAKAIVARALAPYSGDVYLFGSCADGRASSHSDIDIGIDSAAPRDVMAAIDEAMEESAIPYFVDVIDMRRADLEFVAIIRRQGIRWTI